MLDHLAMPLLNPIRLIPLDLGGVVLAAEPKLEFNRVVRPILSENCFQCHGQDPQHRESKLRLDERESTTRDRDGYAVIVSRKPEQGELMRRILSNDDDERMPPPDTHKHLTAEQIATLRRWIAEGGEFQTHW